MFMNPFRRRDNPFLLLVGMVGVRMGDRFAQLGCADGGRLAAVAAKVGLSGRAMAIVADEASAHRARRGAERAGVLVEVEVAPLTRLPVEDRACNVVVVDDTAGLMAAMSAGDQAAMVREIARVLEPGGRVMVISAGERIGLGALVTRTPGGPRFDAQPSLQAGGFKPVRLLAEREGLVFVEGLKQRV